MGTTPLTTTETMSGEILLLIEGIGVVVFWTAVIVFLVRRFETTRRRNGTHG